ncbi:MAG: MraY family glycosyltransferase [Gammaproteobacteria bacterium]
MTVIVSGLTFLVGALTSWLLCARLLAWLTHARVLDVPNERSLHRTPVPRGGGLAVAGVTLVAVVVLGVVGELPPRVAAGLLVTAGGAAALGWADDRRDRSAALRLGCQLLLSAAAVFVLGGHAVEALPLPALPAAAVLVLAMVWHINLFNFMDGADGFAGTQALTAALGLAALALLHGAAGLALLAAALGGAVAGFLAWNWAPARMFLGDSGSYFLGLLLAALVVLAYGAGVPFAALGILLCPFVTDASLTLAWRILRGEAFWRAHRSHAYQLAILAGVPPARAALLLAGFMLLVCWPLAYVAARPPLPGWPAAAAYGLAGIIWGVIKLAASARPSTP